MPNGSIVDISSGAAQTVGRYFSVVSVIPSSFYVVFTYILIASGSLEHEPDWRQAFTSFGHLGVAGIALLALFSIGLGVAIHPVQFAIVQFFEGYWGTRPVAQSIRSQRILHYQRLLDKLEAEQIESSRQLNVWSDAGIAASPADRAALQSRYDEAIRVRDIDFPRAANEVMPTRLGNVLRRAESLAGSQYGLNALQIVPHLLLVAPANHVDYVNDQRSQLDLAVRMIFISIASCITAIVFLYSRGLWVLVAIIPYALAYLSYRGAVVAARDYGSALDSLINLDRFVLYQQFHLRLPRATEEEQAMNEKLKLLLDYDDTAVVDYEHPVVDGSGSTS
jgi:hypothetical protein